MDAILMLSKPAAGKAHTLGHHSPTLVIIEGKEVYLLLDSGASCSVVGSKFLSEIIPNWKEKLMPCSNTRFSGCGSNLFPLGVIPLAIIFPHTQGSMRMQVEFVVMENANPKYFILGDEFLSLYGIDIVHSRESYFTIGNENKKKKFALPMTKQILPVYTEDVKEQETLGKIEEGIKEAGFGPKLNSEQKQELIALIKKYYEQFGLGEQQLGKIENHPGKYSFNNRKTLPSYLEKSTISC